MNRKKQKNINFTALNTKKTSEGKLCYDGFEMNKKDIYIFGSWNLFKILWQSPPISQN